MSIIGDLWIKLGLSTGSFHTDVDKATAKLRQSAGQMKAAVRKESQEARAAVDLLGQHIGVQLPREVRKFIASNNAIAPALAAAFKASIVIGFAAAIGTAIVKGIEWLNLTDETAESMRKVDAAARQTTLTLDHMAQAGLRATRESLRASREAIERQMAGLERREELSGGLFLRVTTLGLSRLDARAAAKEVLELKDKLQDLRLQEDQVSGAMAKLTQKDVKEQEKAMKEAAKAVKDFITNLQEQSFAHGKTAAAVNLHKAALLGITDPKILNDIKNLSLALENFGGKAVAPKKLSPEAILPPDLRDTMWTWGKFGATFSGVFGEIHDAAAGLKAPLTEMQVRMEAFGQAGLMSIGDAAMGLSSWSNVARTIISDLGRMLWYLLVVKPLMGSIFGGSFAGRGSGVAPMPVFSSMATPGFNPGFAAGGHFSAGQMITVGERGPEPVIFDRPGTVIPNGRGIGGGVTNIFNIDARDADLGAEHRVRRGLAAMERRAVAAAMAFQVERARRTA